MQVPADLKYTEDHEWVKVEGDIAVIGITDYAQGELGDVVFVEIETEGEDLDQEEVFGTVEAVKTVSDLMMPVTGEIIEVNEELDGDPGKVNEDPMGAGWFIKVKMSDTAELDELMEEAAYLEGLD